MRTLGQLLVASANLCRIGCVRKAITSKTVDFGVLGQRQQLAAWYEITTLMSMVAEDSDKPAQQALRWVSVTRRELADGALQNGSL